MLEKNNDMKIMDLIFRQPSREFHIRELARLTGLSAPTIILAVKRLRKKGIIDTHRKGNMKIIKAADSANFVRAKRIYNIQTIYESGIVEHLNSVYEDPQAIILFGSFSRGDDVEKSDVDIAVVTNLHKKPDLNFFEEKIGKQISIHEIDVKKVSKEFMSNLANGIVLEGAL